MNARSKSGREGAHDMTNKNASWNQWYAELCRYAQEQGGSAADADAWREGYDKGRTPAEEWADAWG